WFEYMNLARKRQWPEAVSPLLGKLAGLPEPTRYPDGHTVFQTDNGAPGAVHALAAYPDAAVWRKARSALATLAQQGRISAGARDHAISLVPDPDANNVAAVIALKTKNAVTDERNMKLSTLD